MMADVVTSGPAEHGVELLEAAWLGGPDSDGNGLALGLFETDAPTQAIPKTLRRFEVHKVLKTTFLRSTVTELVVRTLSRQQARNRFAKTKEAYAPEETGG